MIKLGIEVYSLVPNFFLQPKTQMKKVHYANPHYWGKTLSVPIDLEVKVAEDGAVELSNECAELMLNKGGANWQKLADEAVENIVEDVVDEDDAENIVEDVVTEDKPVEDTEDASKIAEAQNSTPKTTNSELLKSLILKSLEELKSLAAEAGLDQAEWGKMKKSELAKYLANKVA